MDQVEKKHKGKQRSRRSRSRSPRSRRSRSRSPPTIEGNSPRDHLESLPEDRLAEAKELASHKAVSFQEDTILPGRGEAESSWSLTGGAANFEELQATTPAEAVDTWEIELRTKFPELRTGRQNRPEPPGKTLFKQEAIAQTFAKKHSTPLPAISADSKWKGNHFKGLEEAGQMTKTETYIRHWGQEHIDTCFPGLSEIAGRKRQKWLPEIGRRALERNPCSCNVAAAEGAAQVCKAKMLEAERAYIALHLNPPDQIHQKKFSNSIRTMAVERPFFMPPVPPRRTYGSGGFAFVSKTPLKAPLNLENSVFSRRKMECDGKAYLDTEKVSQRRLHMDWERATGKNIFRKAIIRQMANDTETKHDLDTELTELRVVFEEHYTLITKVFDFYSCALGQAGNGAYMMKVNAWYKFCQDSGLADPDSLHCKKQDLDVLFKVTNFEEGDKSSTENKINCDVSLMRFEFVEILIRAAMAKYGNGQHTWDASTALVMLIQNDIIPNMDPTIGVESNVFRVERLYVEEVNVVFYEHLSLLKAVFNSYKAASPSKWLDMVEWCTLIDHLNLFHPFFEMSDRKARLIFKSSQMIVIDELKNRKRVCGASFTDFLEAIARLSELIAPPPEIECREWLEDYGGGVESDYITWEFFTKNMATSGAVIERRPSAEPLAPKTRPLHEKLEQILQYMEISLMKRWDATSVISLEAKLSAITAARGGTHNIN